MNSCGLILPGNEIKIFHWQTKDMWTMDSKDFPFMANLDENEMDENLMQKFVKSSNTRYMHTEAERNYWNSIYWNVRSVLLSLASFCLRFLHI